MDEQKERIIGEILGKREMLLYLQRACIANRGVLTLADINKYHQVALVQERVFHIEEYEGETERAVRLESTKIAEKER